MKAYLVTFTVTTRIVVDSDKNPVKDDNTYLNAVDVAYEKILNNGVGNYLNAENADITEDTECPAGTFTTDNKEVVKL